MWGGDFDGGEVGKEESLVEGMHGVEEGGHEELVASVVDLVADGDVTEFGSLVRGVISELGMVTETEIPVPAKAVRISGLESKILTLSMEVCVLRNWATWSGGGRLSATVP
ncbi:hypothetical protein Ancab_011634 [Ancistrocladus abbreviatus]